MISASDSETAFGTGDRNANRTRLQSQQASDIAGGLSEVFASSRNAFGTIWQVVSALTAGSPAHAP